MEVSTIHIGMTGTGKSEGEKVDLDRIAREGEYATVTFDPSGKLADEMMAQHSAMGRERRLIYQPLNPEDGKVIGVEFVRWSNDTSPLRKELEDTRTKQELIQIVAAVRGISTTRDKPFIDDWLNWVLDLHRFQKEIKPLYWLVLALMFDSSEHRQMMDDCTDAATVDKGREMAQRRKKNQVQAENELGGARRLLRPLMHALFRACASVVPFDLERALREKKQIIINAGGVDKETKRLFILMFALRVIHTVRAYYDRTKKPLHVKIVIDEVGANDLMGEFIINAMQELRKAGCSVDLLTQSTDDWPEGMFDRATANAPEIRVYKAVSPTTIAKLAEILAIPTYDSLAVHFTRDKVQAKGVRRIETVSRGYAVDPVTKKLRTDRRTNEHFITDHETVQEEVKKSGTVHYDEYRASIANLSVGQRFRRTSGGVVEETVIMLEEPWPFSSENLGSKFGNQTLYFYCIPHNLSSFFNRGMILRAWW